MLPDRVLNKRCTILRGTAEADGYGGTVNLDGSDATTIADDVPCRVGSVSTRQKFRDRVSDVTADVNILVVFMNCGTQVLERDRLVVDNINYDVVNIKNPGLMDHHYEITVRVVK